MTEHEGIIRLLRSHLGQPVDDPDGLRNLAIEALEKLDRKQESNLVLIEDAKRWQRAYEKARDDLHAAEERANANAKTAEHNFQRAERLEAVAVRLREALQEIAHIAQQARIGGPRMDGSESFSSPRFQSIRDLARRALSAAPPEEPSDG